MPRSVLAPLSAQEWAEILAEFSPEVIEKEIASFVPRDENYPHDPVEFIEKTLGVHPWSTQAAICNSVRDERSTVVFSGHALGKTFVSAALACWWMSTKKPATVITLAPTFLQVNNLLWRYMRSMARNSTLPGTILDSPSWKVTPDVFGLGLSPRKAAKDTEGAQALAATVQGYHSENMLVILDEAAGLPKMVFDAARSLATGENDRMLAIGNPIAQSGPFWDAMQNPSWNHIHISCLDHPNVVTGENVIPGAVSRSWVESQAMECPEVPPGTPNAMYLPWVPGRWFIVTNLFMSKVLGMAPEEAEDQLIPLSWVMLAQQRYYGEAGEGAIILGMDPARFGTADSVITARQGSQVLFTRRQHGQDSIQLAGWLKSVMEECGAAKCYIDDLGVGSGVLDQARRLGLEVHGVSFSKRAINSTRFVNLRAECWWRVREALQNNNVALLPNDAMMAGDLTSVKYDYDENGRIRLEDKEAASKRIGRSPDAGDSLAYTFAQPVFFADTDESVKRTNLIDLISQSPWGSATVVSVSEDSTMSRWSSTHSGRRRWR